MIIRTMTSRGNDVYGVYSPAVPSVEQMLQPLRTGADCLSIVRTCIKPGCSLQIYRWEKVIPALKNRVAAPQKLREEINASTHV